MLEPWSAIMVRKVTDDNSESIYFETHGDKQTLSLIKLVKGFNCDNIEKNSPIFGLVKPFLDKLAAAETEKTKKKAKKDENKGENRERLLFLEACKKKEEQRIRLE
jgi:hypothetical protein